MRRVTVYPPTYAYMFTISSPLELFKVVVCFMKNSFYSPTIQFEMEFHEMLSTVTSNHWNSASLDDDKLLNTHLNEDYMTRSTYPNYITHSLWFSGTEVLTHPSLTVYLKSPWIYYYVVIHSRILDKGIDQTVIQLVLPICDQRK